MFCAKCGKEMADHSRFCPFCGAAVQQAAPVKKAPVHVSVRKAAPKSEEAPAPKPETPTSTVFITNPVLPEKKPEPMPEPVRIPEPVPAPILEPTPAPQPEQPKPAKKKGRIWLIALICVILVAGAAFGVVKLLDRQSSQFPGVVYLTEDNELMYLPDLKEGTEPVKLLEEDDQSGFPGVWFAPDGSNIYLAVNYSNDSGAGYFDPTQDLYRITPEAAAAGEKPDRIASDVLSFSFIQMLDNGSLVYLQDRSLFLFDGEEEHELAEDVDREGLSSWWYSLGGVNESQTYYYYCEARDDDTCSIYRVPLQPDGKPERLVKSAAVYGMQRFDADGTDVLFYRENLEETYCLIPGEEPQEVGNARGIYGIKLRDDVLSFYYTEYEPTDLTRYDFVSDDGSSRYDELRMQLQDRAVEYLHTLYYWEDGKSEKIDEGLLTDLYSCQYAQMGDSDVLFYWKAPETAEELVDISKVEPSGDTQVWSFWCWGTLYQCVDGQVSPVEPVSEIIDEMQVFALTEQELVLGLQPVDQAYTLLSYTLQDGALVCTGTITEDASIPSQFDDRIYYMTNYSEDNGRDWMEYRNGETALLHADMAGVFYLRGGTLYEEIYEAGQIVHTMSRLHGGEKTEISDEIYCCAFLSAEDVLYADEDGDLWLWDGKESRRVQPEADAIAIYTKEVPEGFGE